MSVIAIGSMWEYMRCHSKSGKSIFLRLQLLLHFCSDLQCANHTSFSPGNLPVTKIRGTIGIDGAVCVCVRRGSVPGSASLQPREKSTHGRTGSPYHTLFNGPPGLDLACCQFVCVCVLNSPSATKTCARVCKMVDSNSTHSVCDSDAACTCRARRQCCAAGVHRQLRTVFTLQWQASSYLILNLA